MADLGYTIRDTADSVDTWPEPDMSILRPARRAAPAFPLDVLGPQWSRWMTDAADAAAAPVDYVALPLLASASVLIGHARWPQASSGWNEPPHLWLGVVGDSGSSKSPGADCLMRDVLPEIERQMAKDFPDQHSQWKAANETYEAKKEQWVKDVRQAEKTDNPPPMPPVAPPPEPQLPRLRQNDVTIERVASLLSHAAPKGLLVVRDELAGWLAGLNAYNDAGRAFWLEAYGGRPYRVERQKHPDPIVVTRLAVAVTGGTQPERLAQMFQEADDGLLARMIWAWPEPIKFRLGRKAPNIQFALDALHRLRLLELSPETLDAPASPVFVPLVDDNTRRIIESFGQDMQEAQQIAGGLLRSAYGKARGLVLRLSLNIEMLRWAASPGYGPPPATIGESALLAACGMVAEYFMPMAARVYGDASATDADRNAITLAKWINQNHPREVHVRQLQREIRLPGLGNAETIHAAAGVLVEADWLRKPAPGTQHGRAKAAYAVNPHIVSAESALS